MAAAARAHYGEAAGGILILPHNVDGAPPPGFEVFPAGHPVPDEGSTAAAEAALALAGSLQANDLLLVLLSGGGSALMCLPAAGVGLADKQALTRRLLACGATIGEVNTVRKHLSRIKGGRLAAACAAPVVTLAISDVPGDDPAMIASGPTLPDPTTLKQAREVLARFAIDAPPEIAAALSDPRNETPSEVRGRTADRAVIVACAATALEAAAQRCRTLGIEPIVLDDDLEIEAARLAAMQAGTATALVESGQRCCILCGGETTTRVREPAGRGGRNTVYALELAKLLEGQPGVWALAADTDGIDGRGGHAGALVDPDILARAAEAGLDPDEHLARCDSAAFFEGTGNLLVTGPTGTNVNDFRAVLIDPPD